MVSDLLRVPSVPFDRLLLCCVPRVGDVSVLFEAEVVGFFFVFFFDLDEEWVVGELVARVGCASVGVGGVFEVVFEVVVVGDYYEGAVVLGGVGTWFEKRSLVFGVSWLICGGFGGCCGLGSCRVEEVEVGICFFLWFVGEWDSQG